MKSDGTKIAANNNTATLTFIAVPPRVRCFFESNARGSTVDYPARQRYNVCPRWLGPLNSAARIRGRFVAANLPFQTSVGSISAPSARCQSQNDNENHFH